MGICLLMFKNRTNFASFHFCNHRFPAKNVRKIEQKSFMCTRKRDLSKIKLRLFFIKELEIDWSVSSTGWNEKRTLKHVKEDELWSRFFQKIICQNHKTLKKFRLESIAHSFNAFGGVLHLMISLIRFGLMVLYNV